MATSEEDFSFPATTTDSPPCFIESPPLWRPSTSPTASHEKPENYKGKEVEDGEKFDSCFSHDDDEDEKMDLLWENLNDECSRKVAENSDNSSPGREVQMKCGKALKLSKANGNMLSGKKPSILVFIKVLKKVFFMSNSRRPIKKRACSFFGLVSFDFGKEALDPCSMFYLFKRFEEPAKLTFLARIVSIGAMRFHHSS
ncbi:hypothetical protein BUALT_Bualt08G0133400 [Buddleja alternifolia]|uniref:Uncharacterized protein n=1 Tax=Buddleja alternifolia TaxID=168488 RepID=A0AAV6X7N6_9LAMI|nr:hypothetical protein BUALT_Bualt08G0133400 [Buddleja alternifolia]